MTRSASRSSETTLTASQWGQVSRELEKMAAANPERAEVLTELQQMAAATARLESARRQRKSAPTEKPQLVILGAEALRDLNPAQLLTDQKMRSNKPQAKMDTDMFGTGVDQIELLDTPGAKSKTAENSKQGVKPAQEVSDQVCRNPMSAMKPYPYAAKEIANPAVTRGVTDEMVNLLERTAMGGATAQATKGRGINGKPSRWRVMAFDHLKEFLPTLYRELKEEARVAVWLDRRVNETQRLMSQLTSEGQSETDAWETAREHLLPTPEPELEQDEPTDPEMRMVMMGAQLALPDEDDPTSQ